MHNDALESAIREIKLIGDDQWRTMLGQAMEEQPHLMAFLINISDDFTEEVHEQLLRITVLLAIAFQKAGININLITPASLDKVIEEKVDAYEELEEELEDEDELEVEAMKELANSPIVFDRIRKWVDEELGIIKPTLVETRTNINLMVDIIISVLEEHAVDPNAKPTQADA